MSSCRATNAKADVSRRLRVGASEIAAVLGADPYRTPQDVWRAKVHNEPFIENEHIIRGKCLEAGILTWWEVASGMKLARRSVDTKTEAGLSEDPRQHPLVHPCGWAAATLDGITEDGRMVVEAKCPASGKAWDDRTQQHPQQYHIQVLWQLGVAKACGFPVEEGELIAGPIWGRLQRHRIEPDDEFFRLALERARIFIESVKSGEPLPATFGGI